MLDPLAKRLVLPQCPPNTESKVSGVRVHESRCNATIAPMAVDKDEFDLTHLPSLFQNLAENSVEHDLSWMVAVKVNLHVSLPFRSVVRANRCHAKKNSRIIGHLLTLLRARFNSDLVVDSLPQPLFTAEVFFSGLYRDVAQKELDLFQLTSSAVAETGARSSEIMWREFRDSQFLCVFLYDVPNHFLGYLRTPYCPFPADTSEQFALSDVSRIHPFVDGSLHPFRHRNRTDVSGLSNEVNNGPVIFAALNVVKRQIDQLSSTQSTAEQHGKDGTIPLSFQRVCVRVLPEGAGLFNRQPIP